MALTDENVLLMAMYLFVFVFLFALGIKKHPIFLVLGGVVAIIFGIEIGNLTRVAMPNAALIITAVMAFVGIMFIVYGFVHKTEGLIT